MSCSTSSTRPRGASACLGRSGRSCGPTTVRYCRQVTLTQHPNTNGNNSPPPLDETTSSSVFLSAFFFFPIIDVWISFPTASASSSSIHRSAASAPNEGTGSGSSVGSAVRDPSAAVISTRRNPSQGSKALSPVPPPSGSRCEHHRTVSTNCTIRVNQRRMSVTVTRYTRMASGISHRRHLARNPFLPRLENSMAILF